jgi:hypothetical protein
MNPPSLFHDTVESEKALTMWRPLAVVALTLGLTSCGGDSEPSLEGVWAADLANTSCVIGFAFRGPNVEQDLICGLTDGSTGIESTVGVFVRTAERLALTATHSSCPGPRHTSDLGYTLEGNTLTLVSSGAVLVLKSVPKMSGSSGGGVAIFGCFDDELTFTTSPIVPLN